MGSARGINSVSDRARRLLSSTFSEHKNDIMDLDFAARPDSTLLESMLARSNLQSPETDTYPQKRITP